MSAATDNNAVHYDAEQVNEIQDWVAPEITLDPDEMAGLICELCQDHRTHRAIIYAYRTELERIAACEPAHRNRIRELLNGGAK